MALNGLALKAPLLPAPCSTPLHLQRPSEPLLPRSNLQGAFCAHMKGAQLKGTSMRSVIFKTQSHLEGINSRSSSFSPLKRADSQGTGALSSPVCLLDPQRGFLELLGHKSLSSSLTSGERETLQSKTNQCNIS